MESQTVYRENISFQKRNVVDMSRFLSILSGSIILLGIIIFTFYFSLSFFDFLMVFIPLAIFYSLLVFFFSYASVKVARSRPVSTNGVILEEPLTNSFYVGSRQTGVFHRSECRFSKLIKPEFEEAGYPPQAFISSGYRPCKACILEVVSQ